MAEREESTSEGGLSARCIPLLEEVKEIIEGCRDPATNTTTNGDETSALRHASEGAQTTEVSQLDPEPCSQRVIQNFRLLFFPYPARSVPGQSLSPRNNYYRPPLAKKPKKTGFCRENQPIECWTWLQKSCFFLRAEHQLLAS